MFVEHLTKVFTPINDELRYRCRRTHISNVSLNSPEIVTFTPKEVRNEIYHLSFREVLRVDRITLEIVIKLSWIGVLRVAHIYKEKHPPIILVSITTKLLGKLLVQTP